MTNTEKLEWLERNAILKHNARQLVISLDQTLNCLIAVIVVLLSYLFRRIHFYTAWADETLSAMAWRWHVGKVRSWPRGVIDVLALLFRDKDHCQVSYESELKRQHSPPECRV